MFIWSQHHEGLKSGQETQLCFNVLLIFLFIGTHGTGLTIGNIASLVTKLKFVNGKGEVSFWPKKKLHHTIITSPIKHNNMLSYTCHDSEVL